MASVSCPAARTAAFLVSEYGADATHVTLLLSGFSHGAIGAWAVGLADDTVAGLWSSFLIYAHYNGEYPFGHANVTSQLLRLNGRPAFVANCNVSNEKADVLATVPAE